MKRLTLFHPFFLQFVRIAEIGQKVNNTTTSRPPVPYILQILTTFNLYSGKPRVSLLANNKKRSDKQWLRFKTVALPHWQDILAEMAWQSPPPSPPWQDMLAEMAWQLEGNTYQNT